MFCNGTGALEFARVLIRFTGEKRGFFANNLVPEIATVMEMSCGRGFSLAQWKNVQRCLNCQLEESIHISPKRHLFKKGGTLRLYVLSTYFVLSIRFKYNSKLVLVMRLKNPVHE